MKKSTISIAIAAALFGMNAVHASEFDGAYIGAKAGVNNAAISGSGTAAIPSAAGKNASTVGIEAGYNWDLGNFLLGVDGFADFNQKTTHTMNPTTVTTGNFGSTAIGLDMKLGLPTNSWMPYAKMGWDRTSISPANALFTSKNHLHYGIGLEYKWTSNLAVAVEYTRTGSKGTATNLTNDNFTVGLNYYFAEPKAAVIAPVVLAPVVAPVVQKPVVVAPVVAAPVVAPVVKKEEVKMRTIFTDKPVTIEGTSFDTGSAKLKPTANVQLNQVVDFAAKNKDANLTVTGYTDNRGSAKLNDKLSAKRAASVKAYLVKKGVDAKRIEATGKGMANPIGDNKTNAGRALNRRVEINSVVKEEKKVRAD